MADKRWLDAWEQLAKLPLTPPALDLQVQTALALERPSDALRAWDQLSAFGNGTAALRRIATHAARRLGTASDPMIRQESERLLAAWGDLEARDRLRRRMADTAAPALERAAAAAALASGGDAAAATRFEALAKGVQDREQFGLIRLTTGLPDATAVAVLGPMLRSPRSDVRYSATLALGDRRGPAVTRVLREFLAGAPEGAARLAAMLALAAHGDRAMLGELGKIALQFGDRESLAYARALMAIGDPQATRFLAAVQNSDDDLLRLEAAALVAKSSPAAGRDQLLGALGNQNLWVRVRALELLRDVPPAPNTFAHLLVAPEEWIRLRSAELAIASVGAPAARP